MREVNGIFLPAGDSHIADHLLRGPLYKDKGTYQLAKIEACIEHCRAAGRIGLALDIGAHVGTWSRVLADVFEQVSAFEPMEHLRQCFLKNVPMDNVQLWNCGLSDKTGFLAFAKVIDNSGNCRVALDTDKFEVKTSVDTIRLDEFNVSRRVDFIKIDVEGFEVNVLRGAEVTIKTSKPFIMIEQKPATEGRYGHKQFDGLELLKAWGMEQVYYRSGDHLMKFPT